jgi:c-di-GMP-binding flagellar brake protein YcgR
MERRERDRVNVRLQCRIDQRGRRESAACNVTENISRTGMLIRWEQERSAVPGVGDSVVVKLKLPANPLFGQRWMLFQAQVVRVSEAADESLMVAVAGSPVRVSSAPIEAQSPSGYVN